MDGALVAHKAAQRWPHPAAASAGLQVAHQNSRVEAAGQDAARVGRECDAKDVGPVAAMIGDGEASVDRDVAAHGCECGGDRATEEAAAAALSMLSPSCTRC